jgi:hypothetical protein
VRRRRAEATVIERGHRRAFPQVSTSAVGLAGLEPAASSLSGIEDSALCGAAFSQVTAERQGQSYAFLATWSQAVQANQITLPLVRDSMTAELVHRLASP